MFDLPGRFQRGKGLKMLKGCQIVGLLIVLSIWHCSADSGTKAHHFMSEEDLRKIFQVEYHTDVPNYEVVRIHSVRHIKRSSSDEVIHRVRLETRGKRLNLELTPNRHLIRRDQPVGLWYADVGKTANTSVNYVPGPEDTEHIGDVYHDERNRAAMLLYRDKTDDALLMDGTIGDDLVVKPLPSKIRSKIVDGSIDVSQDQDGQPSNLKDFGFEDGDFQDDLIRHTNETDDYEFLDEDDVDVPAKSSNRLGGRGRSKREIHSEFHVVFKRKDSQTDHSSDYHFMEMDQFPTKPSFRGTSDDETLSRTKRQAPYIIFPEILCIIDYDGYRLHGKDNIAIKRYVISFWNGIDLRYKLLKHPSVKISIAGIIISRGRDATPYLERNRVGNDALDSASALTDMGKYLFLERRLPVYDIAVAITKLDMCRRKSRYGECNRGTAGFAYVGGACVVNKRLEKVNSVAIVEDTGGFSGIIVAAHELGHLLGAVHDGSPPPSYLGGPGAGKCRWEDGFIMSDLRHTSKGFRWSHCTINQFKHFLNGETATCMYNSPHETESLPRVLPGKLLTLDAQCRKDRGTSACFKDGRVCAQLFCFDAASGYCVSYRPAAEGSRCGDGQMCLNGKCVLEHENSVDYEGNGFLRKLGEIDDEEDYNSGDSPAEPSNTNTRKWWNQLKASEKRDSSPSTTSASTTTTSTLTTTPLTTTTTTSSSTTVTATTSSTFNDSSTASTTTRAPWWRRIQRRPPLGAFFIPQPSTKAPKSLAETTTNSSPTEPTTTTSLSTTSSTTITTTSISTTTTTTTSTTPQSTTPIASQTISTTSIKSVTSTPNSLSFTSTPTSTSPSPKSPKRSTSRSRSRSELLSISDRRSDASSNEEAELDGSCEDRITNIAGSLTCKAFLRSFAYQYCRHKYIRTNCCASHKVYCTKTSERQNTTGNARTSASSSDSSTQGEQQQQRRRRQQERRHSHKPPPANNDDSLSAPDLS